MSEETLLAGRGREIERIPATMWREHLRAMASSPQRFSRLDFMTPQHRAVRAFLVVELARNGGRPVSPSRIAEHFRLPVDEVRKLLDDMEPRLFFLVRDTKGEVSWAFPVTAERTVHHLRFDSGEHAFAA